MCVSVQTKVSGLGYKCFSWSVHMSKEQASFLLGEQVAPGIATAMPEAAPAVSGLRSGDSLAALLLSIAERRTLLPTSVEVLPCLCSFADLLRHTLDERIEVVVDVDRECPALRVDRGALEEALMQAVLRSSCAARRRGRLTLRASLDRRSSPQGTLLQVFCSASTEDFSTFEWPE